MNGRKFLLVTIAFLVLAGLSTVYVRPAYAAPVYLANLDANSISQTDIALQTTFGPTHGFRVGALVNATSANPLLNVQGFQFTVHYNATAFAPQGDPNAGAVPGNTAALYVDGATNTVLFGANPNIVNNAGVVENWNGLLTAGAAFRVITVAVTGSAGALTVAYSILGTGTQVKITGPNLLANVAFEFVTKPSTLQSFTVSDVIFVDNTGALIPSVSAGAGVTETVSDIPAVARFTTTHLATGSTACTPVTGVACTAYAFQFDGSTSTDADGTISAAAGTAGFFWDFGDTQTDGFYPTSTFSGGVSCTNGNFATFTCQGAVAIHDYGIANPATGTVPAPGKFNVTLRVQDNVGDTGASRNSLGAPYVSVATPPAACSSPECSSNIQPSHGQQLNLLVDIPPTASFTPTSTTCTSPCTVTFNAASSAPGQAGTTISSYTWNFGDGNTTTVTANTIFHTFTVASGSVTRTVTLTVTDNLGATGQTTGSVMVSSGVAAPTVTVNAPTPNPANEGAPGVTVTWTVTSSATVTASCINWGDGSSVCAASPVSHVYSTGGVASKAFTITVNATDAAGKTGSNTASITINDVAPTVTVTAPASANEGASVSISFTATDDEAISKTCVNFGDGSSVCAASPVSHVYSTGGVASKAFTITVNATDAAGVTGSNTASITINDLAPTVTVTAPASANEGASVSISFTATDDEAISKTCVNFGDGSSVCAASPVSHVYSTGGVASKAFTITVNATDAAGKTGSNTASITINDLAPTVTITSVSPNPVAVGGTVTASFTVTDDEAISRTCINWGDGASACGVASGVTHSYTKSGTFNIVVNATDAAGITGSASASETVGNVPVVSITSLSPNPASEGATVSVMFTVNSSPGAVTSLTVNWADGTIDTLAVTATSDTHIYHLGATITMPSMAFTVTVSATNSTGTGSKTATETVNDLAPTVTVTVPASANEGASVSISFTATDDEPISKTCVNFGDGSSVCAASPVTHVYSTGGVASKAFTITVKATDAAGVTGSNTASITINDLAPIVTITNVSPNPATSGQTVSLAFTATDDEAISKTCISWGDSVSACGITSPVAHVYTVSVSTIFMITVNATDTAGLTGKATSSETVNPSTAVPPVVTVNAPTPNPALTGQTVTVTWAVSSSATVTASCINWGDGTSACGLVGIASATHTYANTGNAMSETFTITVNATNSAGTGQGTNMEIVNDKPPIAVIAGPGTATTGQTVTFDGSGSTDPDGTITNFSWNFGDGAMGTGVMVMHTYAIAGSFIVTLTVTDNGGNTNSTTHAITVTGATVHAPLAHGKASPAHHHFSLSKDGTTQTFFATGLDDGQTAVQAYVVFHVTGDAGVDNLTFTQVVTLQPGQLFDGKTNSSFSSAYTITAVASYSVTAEIFFNNDLSPTCHPP